MFVFLALVVDELVELGSKKQNFFDNEQFELQIFQCDQVLQIRRDCRYRFQKQKVHFHGHIFPFSFQNVDYTYATRG